MASSLFQKRIKKKDVGEFCQKMAMLLEAGYDACSGVRLLSERNPKKRSDKSAENMRRICVLLLPALMDGYPLNEAMRSNKAVEKLFHEYLQQVKVGEESGKTAEVLQRISLQIKRSGKVMSRLKGAMIYPIVVLTLTFAVAMYLFSTIIPEMLGMVADLGVTDVPWTTRAVMAFGSWVKTKGVFLFVVIAIAIILLVIYSKTIGDVKVAKASTRLPLLGKVIENNSMAQFFRSWEQMILAGAEMSVSLKSAADAVSNLYIKKEMMFGQRTFAENGVPVHEAIGGLSSVKTLESQTIRVAMEGGSLAKTLDILAEDREFEANRAVDGMIAAINPIMIVIVGIIVGILVLAVYMPIISVSQSLKVT